MGPIVGLPIRWAYGTLRETIRGFAVLIDLRFPRPAALDSATPEAVLDSARAAPQAEASPTPPGPLSVAAPPATPEAALQSVVEVFELAHFGLEGRREEVSQETEGKWGGERDGGTGGEGKEKGGEVESGNTSFGLCNFPSLVPSPSPRPCSQASTPASFPVLHPGLVPRPPPQPRSQSFTPASFPGLHPGLVPRPPPQPRSQSFTPASFPGLVPRPPPQLLSLAEWSLGTRLLSAFGKNLRAPISGHQTVVN